MYTLIIISLIFFGLVFGSFGSVIFYRLGEWPTKETWKGFLVGRSECPKCHHQLKARNLVPILSRLFQGGKCEYCKAPISRFYPFLEITTVIIFLSVFFILSKYGIPGYNIGIGEGYIFTIFITISARLLRLIFLYDIKTYELHITATVFLAVITLFFTLFFGNNKLEILLGIGIFTLVFLLIYYGSKNYVKEKYKKDAEGFGLGDVIIAPILGAWLVFFLQPNGIFERCYLVCLFIILSSLVGLIHYLLLNTKIGNIISAVFIFISGFYSRFFINRSAKRQENKEKKKSKKPYGFENVIPFLPSMIIGFILEIILREPIINLLYF